MTEVTLYRMNLFVSGSGDLITIKNVTKSHATDIVRLLLVCWVYYKEQNIIEVDAVADLFDLTPEQKQMLHNYEGSDISLWSGEDPLWELDLDEKGNLIWKEVKCEQY